MIDENVNLKPFNTFGISVTASKFARFTSVEELDAILRNTNEKNPLILGGGSNVLFTKNIDRLILKNEIKGFEVNKEDDAHVYITAGAGENWHEFVLHCIKNNWGGIENLSLIPGNVGASPMQNIGAYGVEIKDVFESLTAYNIATGELKEFKHEDCQFGYRESVFKRALKDQYIILKVTYRLNKQPKVNTSYGAIEDELKNKGVENPSIKDVSNAVIAIRQSKLPDPNKIGNAGSFFKNPVVPIAVLKNIQEHYPNAPFYPIDEDKVKIPAGWLIEQAGWKGKDFGGYGVHSRQALVLVNLGKATGDKVFNLSEEIIADIHKKFGVKLEREVNIYP